MSDLEDAGLDDQANPPQNTIAPVPENDDETVPEISAALQSLPPESRREFMSILAMFQSGVRPPTNPLFNKFNDAHIDKYLDYLQRDDDNTHNLRKSNRWFYLGYFIIAIIAVGFVIVFLLPRDRDLLLALIQILLALAGGIGAGYGLKSRDRH